MYPLQISEVFLSTQAPDTAEWAIKMLNSWWLCDSEFHHCPFYLAKSHGGLLGRKTKKPQRKEKKKKEKKSVSICRSATWRTQHAVCQGKWGHFFSWPLWILKDNTFFRKWKVMSHFLSKLFKELKVGWRQPCSKRITDLWAGWDLREPAGKWHLNAPADDSRLQESAEQRCCMGDMLGCTEAWPIPNLPQTPKSFPSFPLAHYKLRGIVTSLWTRILRCLFQLIHLTHRDARQVLSSPQMGQHWFMVGHKMIRPFVP